MLVIAGNNATYFHYVLYYKIQISANSCEVAVKKKFNIWRGDRRVLV